MEKAQRISNMALSEIVQLSEAASQMRAKGGDVISLGTGEPDFPTPPHICDAAYEAMKAGETRYPPTAGTPALRLAIAQSSVGDYASANVIVSTGAKQVLANAFAATLNKGHEVIMPAPYWASYSDIVSVFDGTPIILTCGADQSFKVTPEQLEAAITPATKWVLINSPSNPSGMVYTHDELVALGAVLERHPHVWVMSDEIYEFITFAPFTSFATALPHLKDRLLIVNGASKAHSMTGWRLGWGLGPEALIKAMVTVQGQVTSGASSISQAAAYASLHGDRSHLEERRLAFQARRDMLLDALDKIDGIECLVPDGAFYLFPSCEALIGRKTPDGTLIESDADFCAHILASTGLVVIPGRAFGIANHFRISYAYAEETLKDAVARLAKAVALLSA